MKPSFGLLRRRALLAAGVFFISYLSASAWPLSVCSDVRLSGVGLPYTSYSAAPLPPTANCTGIYLLEANDLGKYTVTFKAFSGGSGKCGSSFDCAGGGGKCGNSYECTGQGAVLCSLIFCGVMVVRLSGVRLASAK